MKYRASRVALLGLLFALSMVLSFVESGFAGLIPIPGIKPGLSNIVTMYCLFCLGRREAYTLALLKSFFVFLTRGAVGAAMSLAGGLLSVSVMLILLLFGEKKFSDTFLSVCGGVSHNVGQILMAMLVLGSTAVVYYLPVLMISGVAMGVITGMLLRYLMPHLNRFFF
ncbi:MULTISPECIES: Gx transporter family protein [Anaerotruncus]|uniref:Gx transporter family protein n=1 Tax=Anaerotruncus TaxID=244127 RepID=UPI0008358B83|nr:MULTISPECIES: Gx transporter family protein [Anaerotruncus]RGX56458.1 Gx transporter family protein [Anaerotruncus sp. AF02-27]